MVQEEDSTWHFVREDSFGGDMEYIYTIEDSTLVLTTIDSKGRTKVNSTSYSIYNMTKETDVMMAFNAIKSTCESGNGNENVTKTCTTELRPVINYGEINDSRDNKTYKTVTIGDQEWMAENLKSESNGRFWIADSEYFYTWASALNGEELFDEDSLPRVVQGICPEGWHIPSKTDFDSLIAYTGGRDSSGINLKAIANEGTDIFGFSANLIGYYNITYDRTQYAGDEVDFWAADNSNWRKDEYATSFGIGNSASIDEFPKDWGASVRCVKAAK